MASETDPRTIAEGLGAEEREAVTYLDRVDFQPWRGPVPLHDKGLAVYSEQTGFYYITPPSAVPSPKPFAPKARQGRSRG